MRSTTASVAAPARSRSCRCSGQISPTRRSEQLAAFEATFARYGGVAHARVVARYWHGVPVLTPEQQRAAAGLP